MPDDVKIPPQSQNNMPADEHKMDPAPDYMPRHAGVGKLDGQVALITGGDSGIGRAVSVLFAREGARVAIAYLDEDKDSGGHATHMGLHMLQADAAAPLSPTCAETDHQTTQLDL